MTASGLYIVISTMMVGDAIDGESEIVQMELAKGLVFVFVSGLALYVGAHFLLAHIAKQSRQIEQQRHSINALDRRASSGLLASAIGHDANNLLTTVRMSVDMLRLNISSERREQIISTLSGVVDELMILNRRLVSGGQAEQPGELKEHCLKNESERVLHFLDQNHPVSRLDIKISSEGDVSTMINRHLYFQVLLNLLTNIVRHAGETAKAQVHVEEYEDEVRVSVEDDGPGVPEEIQERIFEPYFSQHPEGAGLGLASVRAIMRMHKGEVTCEKSSLGGAKFLLTFPKVTQPQKVPESTTAD